MRWLVLAASVMFLVAGCTGSNTPSNSSSSTSVIASTPASPSAVELPSQMPAEAARDGVVAAVAALPLSKRVEIVASAPSAEGIWVASLIPDATTAETAGGVLGDSTGPYGKSWVQAAEYGEVLLLNSERTSVLRAYPLPGVAPQRLLVTDDAVYAERQGDGGLPVSMLFRVDRGTLAAIVRLFPTPLESAPQAYLPANWSVNAPIDKTLFEAIKSYGPQIWVSGADGEAQVELDTLALRTVVPVDPAKRALADRVRAYLQTNQAFIGQLAAFPEGPVLCGVELLGTSDPKREIYATVLCGNYGAVDGVATQISAWGTPIVLTTAGLPATSAIIAFKVPGNDEQEGRDIEAWFPPSIAERVLRDSGHFDLTESDLLAEAQSLLASGQLPAYNPSSG